VAALTVVRENAQSPFVLILGGSKVSDKIAVIQNFIDKADAIIVGGAMAYTFLKAEGVPVGKSLVEENKVGYAKELLERMDARNKRIYLPVDHVVTQSLSQPENNKVSDGVAIDPQWLGADIGPKTIKEFSSIISEAKTVFWNGPMGVYETPPFNKGSFAIASAIAKSDAFSVIGGGDSAAAAMESGFSDKMGHISTGGGASLEFMEGKTLPGLAALGGK
jgi:phosphoglycerate kinase